MLDPQSYSARTWLVSAGRPHGPQAPLNPDITLASTFELGGERMYSRSEGTGTWDALETVLGGLENAQAVTYSSGMAAVAAVFSLVPPDGRVVIPADCYHGVTATAREGADARRWTTTVLEVGDTQAWIDALDTADLVWIESPTNPLLEIAELPAILRAPRPPSCVVAVDNTFATPLRQQPLELGADITMQSTTKYVGGHSDLLGGSVATRRSDLFDGLRGARSRMGATPGALESYLALRGLRTLALRLDAATANAQVLAERLQAHPAVLRVRYPGLPEHPGHAEAAAQLSGFGTMISFDLADAAAADRACGGTTLIRNATSLGGVESTMERRATTPGQEHLPAGLIRLSVGVEDVDDLWNDLSANLPGDL